MKKMFTLALGLVLLGSCSSDDSGSSTIDTAQLTNKKWYYSNTIVNGVSFPYMDHEACGKDYIEFLAGGVYRDVDVWDCENDITTGTWSLNGETITVNIVNEGSNNGNIVSLTTNSLTVSSSFDFNEDGTSETVIQNFTSN